MKKLPTFPDGRHNPNHAKVPTYIANNLQLSGEKKDTICELINTLRQNRIDADYKPLEDVDEGVARNCVRDAASVQHEFWGITR